MLDLIGFDETNQSFVLGGDIAITTANANFLEDYFATHEHANLDTLDRFGGTDDSVSYSGKPMRFKADGNVITGYDYTDDEIIIKLDGGVEIGGVFYPTDPIVIPIGGGNGEDIYTESIEVVDQVSNHETYNIGDVNTANANSVVDAEFWITNITPMEAMRGKVLRSITFNAVNSGRLILYGSSVIINKTSDKDTVYADSILAKEYGYIIAEITPTVGINTYKFDGTDNRVDIVGNSLICPNTLGFGGSALYKYNTGYDTGNVIAFGSSTAGIGTGGLSTTNSLAFTFECVEASKKVIKLTLNNGTELTADLPTTDKALPLDGKKLSILGDSISTYSGYNPSGYAVWYPQGDITSVEKTWWKSLANETGLTILKNCAWSGSTVTGDSTSTTNAIAGCSTKRIADLANDTETPDIIICYIGINDFGLTNSRELGEFKGTTAIPTEGTISTFSEAYGLMLKKIMETYPNAFVYCCTLLETKHGNYDQQDNTAFPVLNSKGIALEQYNEVIRELCGAMGARLIELHELGINYWNVDNFTTDGIHPNVAGAKLVKDKIKSKLLTDYQ